MLYKFCPEINSIITFSDSATALNSIPYLDIDLLFLDADMPGLSGFELLQKLTPVKFSVIFVTAHNEFALKALKYNARGYDATHGCTTWHSRN